MQPLVFTETFHLYTAEENQCDYTMYSHEDLSLDCADKVGANNIPCGLNKKIISNKKTRPLHCDYTLYSH